MSSIPRRVITIVALLLGLHLSSGCGFERIQPTPSGTIEGITFESLSEIQDDDTLSVDQKRQAIRDAIGAPETDEGDRLVEFLLNFPTP